MFIGSGCVSVGDNGSYQSEAALCLITSDKITLSEDGTNSTDATTTYAYAAGTGRYADNKSPQWGKVTDIGYPDGSWEHLAYDTNTGWLTDDYTPFKSSDSSQLSQGRDTHFDYDSTTNGGDASDHQQLVERPRVTTTSINGIVTGVAFSQYTAPLTNGVKIPTVVTKLGGSAGATWGNAVLGTNTQIYGYASYFQTNPLGSVSHFASGSQSVTTTKSFANQTVSTNNQYFNPFGGLAKPTAGNVNDQVTAVGQEPDNITASAGSNSFGRDAWVKDNGLTTQYLNYGWFGPQTIIGQAVGCASAI